MSMSAKARENWLDDPPSSPFSIPVAAFSNAPNDPMLSGGHGHSDIMINHEFDSPGSEVAWGGIMFDAEDPTTSGDQYALFDQGDDIGPPDETSDQNPEDDEYTAFNQEQFTENHGERNEPFIVPPREYYTQGGNGVVHGNASEEGGEFVVFSRGSPTNTTSTYLRTSTTGTFSSATSLFTTPHPQQQVVQNNHHPVHIVQPVQAQQFFHPNLPAGPNTTVAFMAANLGPNLGHAPPTAAGQFDFFGGAPLSFPNAMPFENPAVFSLPPIWPVLRITNVSTSFSSSGCFLH